MMTLQVAGHDYQVGKLNALQQFHVTRRLGPTLLILGISMDMLRQGMKVELSDLVAHAGPVVEFLSKMSDEDSEYVIFTCLAVVKRKQGEAWADVLAGGKQLMFADMDFAVMIRLVVAVLKENLGNFLKGLGDEQTSQSS